MTDSRNYCSDVSLDNSVGVLIPSFFGSAILPRTLESLLQQSISAATVYIRDDSVPGGDEERAKLKMLCDEYRACGLNIKLALNETNLGYPKNLQKLMSDSDEELIFLLAQDDVLSPLAIESCIIAFQSFPSAGAISRPYFWFVQNPRVPVREIKPLDIKPIMVDRKSPWASIERVLVAASQLSGLMYRRSAISVGFQDSVFPAHIYPLAEILFNSGVVYLPFPTVAVSINTSQTRHVSSIYNESPLVAWETMYRIILHDSADKRLLRKACREHLGKNFVGLIQIRSYGKYRWFLRETFHMIRVRPLNLFDLRFVLAVIGLAVVSARFAIWITDFYKSKIHSRRCRGVRLMDTSQSWWGI